MKKAAIIIASFVVTGCQNAETARLQEENQRLKAEAFAKSSVPATPLPTPIPQGTFPGDSPAFQPSRQPDQETAPNRYRVQSPAINSRIAPSALIRAIASAHEQIAQTMRELHRQDMDRVLDLGRRASDFNQPNRETIYGADPTPPPLAVTVRGKLKAARNATEQAIATVQRAPAPQDGEHLRAAYLAALTLSLQDIGVQEQESEQMLAAMARDERYRPDVNRAKNSNHQIDQATQKANEELARYQNSHSGELTPQEKAFRL